MVSDVQATLCRTMDAACVGYAETMFSVFTDETGGGKPEKEILAES